MVFEKYRTLTEALQKRARHNPDQLSLVFMGEDGSEERISAREFHTEVNRFALALDAIGVQPEDLVILVLRHSKDLLYAFWGALYLGAISSIFPFLTEKLDPGIYMMSVRELVTHSKAKVVITFPEFKQELTNLLAEAGCRVVSTDEVLVESNVNANDSSTEWPDYSPDKIAFLQHSSGTTGLQKGVALSHRSVLNQISAVSQAIGLGDQDVIVSWLPLYHDMGLIAGFVLPLVTGTTLVLISPFKWVRDPKCLLQAIHRYKGTLCWLPNFAYNHCARVIRTNEIDGLDLSSMRAFINCSEPVYLQSHRVFLEKFQPFGVQEEALSTSYAMAENTFAVTQNPVGEKTKIDWVSTRKLQEERLAIPMEAETPGSSPVVSCGSPILGSEIRVVDEKGEPLPERKIGEIALRSNCMLNGYYRRKDLTSKAILDGWYFTGDMGYLADGELFVTGRKKDLIIVGGKNIYPQDLEAIANEMEGFVPGRCVAFGLYDENLGSEKIVMVCEVEKEGLSENEQRELEMDFRRRVVKQSEVAISDIRLVKRRWLIKTSSGKISRSANRAKYIQTFLSKEFS